MNRYLFILIIALGFAMCQAPSVSTSSSPTDSKASFGNALTTFKTYCTGCHGDNAEVFVDRKWKHGSTRPEIIKSITTGYTDNGMPAWGAALKPQQIEELGDYIMAAIERNKTFESSENSFLTFFNAQT